MDRVRWNLKKVLQEQGHNAYQLTKHTDLARNTVYSAVRGEQEQVHLSTLAGILKGLRELRGTDVDISQILVHEQVPDDDDRSELMNSDYAQSIDDIEAGISIENQDAWIKLFVDQAEGHTK